jgi:hypothetical protein
MKTLLLLFGTAMMLTQQVRSEISLGVVLGTAWTIGDGIIGETTLTPAYCVTDYTFHFGTYSQTNSDPRKYNLYGTFKYHRDLLGNVFYHRSKRIVQGAYYPPSDEPFPVDHVNRLNMTCEGYSTNANNEVIKAGSQTVETHSEMVWLDKVESTGLWPDDGPWKVWLKTAGSKAGCSRPASQASYYYWVSASLGKSGHQTVSLGNPNCTLSYPFYLASDFYK